MNDLGGIGVRLTESHSQVAVFTQELRSARRLPTRRIHDVVSPELTGVEKIPSQAAVRGRGGYGDCACNTVDGHRSNFAMPTESAGS
jgi:hypothetical protein